MEPIPVSRIVEVKPWWKSKTIWLNLISAALLALEAQFGLLQPYLPDRKSVV